MIFRAWHKSRKVDQTLSDPLFRVLLLARLGGLTAFLLGAFLAKRSTPAFTLLGFLVSFTHVVNVLVK
jgi:hypothetical protein